MMKSPKTLMVIESPTSTKGDRVTKTKMRKPMIKSPNRSRINTPQEQVYIYICTYLKPLERLMIDDITKIPVPSNISLQTLNVVSFLLSVSLNALTQKL